METEIKVADIMKKKVHTAEENTNLIEVAKKMKENNIGSLIIINESGAKGIITERDIVWKAVAKGRSLENTMAKDIMSYPLITIEPTKDIIEAAKKMKKENAKKLVVLNDKGILVGIISYGDIVKIFPAIIDIVEERAKIGY